MSESHSPGPWAVAQGRDKVRPHELRDANDDPVGAFSTRIDARLAASAPEMLEALHAWRQFQSSGWDPALGHKAEQMTNEVISRLEGLE